MAPHTGERFQHVGRAKAGGVRCPVRQEVLGVHADEWDAGLHQSSRDQHAGTKQIASVLVAELVGLLIEVEDVDFRAEHEAGGAVVCVFLFLDDAGGPGLSELGV